MIVVLIKRYNKLTLRKDGNIIKLKLQLLSIFRADWFLWKLISGSSQARFVHWVWKVLERKSRRSSMSQRLLSSYWHCFRSIWAQWTYNHQEQFSSHYGWGERQSLQMRLRRWTLRPTWPTKTRSSWLTLRRWTGNTLLRYFAFSSRPISIS